MSYQEDGHQPEIEENPEDFGSYYEGYEVDHDMSSQGGGRKKRRPARDCIDSVCTNVNHDLLISKVFYLFFFSAFGSLFPLLAVYFKQLGLNPTQSGILIGFRPLVEFCSTPIWGSFADKWQKGKQLLLFSLCCWIAFTLAIAFIQPPAHSCMRSNSTGSKYLYVLHVRHKRDTSIMTFGRISTQVDTFKVPHERDRRDTGSTLVGIDHRGVDADGLIHPKFSNIVYDKEDVSEVFLLLLLLVVVGEFFSAPAITFADSVTMYHLGEDYDNYGRQRMFGSLGWGLSMFFVGMALDHSTTFTDHPCGTEMEGEKNYTICFAVFSVLMSCAFVTATQFRFHYGKSRPSKGDSFGLRRYASKISSKVQEKANQAGLSATRLKEKLHLNRKAQEDDPFGKADNYQMKEGSKDLEPNGGPHQAGQGQAGASDDSVQEGDMFSIPKWWIVLKMFANFKYGWFLFLSWFMGFGIGLVFTFLFWHLQDLGGGPTLFGIASVINHVSEIIAYFFSKRLLSQIGHVKIMYIGLLGNVGRFLYISWLQNPWWVLPFEFVQGLTHALVWAVCCSYLTQGTPPHLRGSAQGILQGLHHGLGRGCGAVFGGVLVHFFGSELTFRGYGFACLVILAIFVAMNMFYKRKDPHKAFSDDTEEPDDVLEETTHLAPCGVPVNPMARNLSSSNLEDSDVADAGASYGAVNGKLAPPGHNQHTGSWDETINVNEQKQQRKNEDSHSEEHAIIMNAPPPISTDLHMLQPEQRLSETQYQYQDDW